MPNDGKKGITVKVDEALHAEIRQYLEDNNMTMTEFVTMALTNELHPKNQMKEDKSMVNMRTLAFQVPEDLFQRIKDYLRRSNMTQKDFVIGLIEDELERDLKQQEGVREAEEPSKELGDDIREDESLKLAENAPAEDETEEMAEDSPVEGETGEMAEDSPVEGEAEVLAEEGFAESESEDMAADTPDMDAPETMADESEDFEMAKSEGELSENGSMTEEGAFEAEDWLEGETDEESEDEDEDEDEAVGFAMGM